MGAPTRLSITLVTTTTRSRPWIRASTRSPTSTVVAGFAVRPFTRTWPARHTSVASERDLHNRMAQSHRSTRARGPTSATDRDRRSDREVIGAARPHDLGSVGEHGGSGEEVIDLEERPRRRPRRAAGGVVPARHHEPRDPAPHVEVAHEDRGLAGGGGAGP